jgi:hypothetical protein
MAHLDIRVSDVDAEHERADAHWRVYADPAGHPFCLCGPPSA